MLSAKSRCCLADDVFFAPMPDAAFTPHPAAVFMGSQWLNNRSPSLYIDLCNCLILICSIQHQMKVNLW
ncbi:hypothetical protein, partial [Escherichia coli]|uniref:hypothetical protein n=1 Tax=Escherichia coli TaxID=562 RepID=UPI001BC8A3A7